METEAEKALREAHENLKQAKEYYKNALRRGGWAGLSNQKMANVVGVSETAIRNYRKRHQL